MLSELMKKQQQIKASKPDIYMVYIKNENKQYLSMKG